MSNLDKIMQGMDYTKTKNVVVSIDTELWKAAKMLAAKQDRAVKLVVADGLRLLLKEDQASVEEALGCAPSLTGLSPEEAIRRSR